MKSVEVSGDASSSAAAMPPHRPWPMTTIDRHPEREDGVLEAALAAWLRLSGS